MFIGFGDPGKRGRVQQEDAIEQGWTERDLIKGITHLYGMVSRAEEQAERDNGLPCKAGCSWCCENVTVLLTHAEWMVVLQHLKVGEPKLVRRLLRKALVEHKRNKEVVEQITASQEQLEMLTKEHATHLEQHKENNEEILEQIAIHKEETEQLAASIKSPCPMLEDGLCSVYEARPHDCRMYGCSFKGEELFACHLVIDAVAGKPVTAPDYEASARVLHLYPRTGMRQTFAYWAKNHMPDALRELALSQEAPT